MTTSSDDVQRLREFREKLHDTAELDDPEKRAEPLEELLSDAALGPWRSFGVGRSAVELAGALARRPGAVGRRLGELGTELARIATGSSELAPNRRDRRFRDPNWQENPLLRRTLQAYLASSATAQGLVEDAELGWESAQKVEFVLENLIEALSPSNSPLTNPTAIKEAVDSRGSSYVKGAWNLLRDMSAAPRVPSMVDTSGFVVGENLAATPGSVVHREELFELIQYTPTTETVSETPLVIFPPMINKYYGFDLAPKRSLVEYLVGQGLQVFMVSWRNPRAEHRDWGFDAYGKAILTAMDVAQANCGTEKVHVLAACSGGQVTSLVMGHLAHVGELDRVASLTLLVTVLDSSRAGLSTALTTKARADVVKAVSMRKGYLDGRTLAEVFAWLRPGDLIWNYWVNNYLLGKEPPAFDILAWNADVTRMPMQLHHDFIDMGVANAAVTPGMQTMLGSPVDLSKVNVDSYILAGEADHLTDWKSCYATRRLLGGTSRFVLSSSGHVAALVNPPGNPRAKYLASGESFDTPEEFQQAAEAVPGTWWDDLVAWLRERGGGEVPAPTVGAAGHDVLGPAPGTYVFER